MTSTWINYNHPEEGSSALNKGKVASYIGKYYRNRSKPTSRSRNSIHHTAPSRYPLSPAIHEDFQILQWDSKHKARRRKRTAESLATTQEPCRDLIAVGSDVPRIPRMRTAAVALTSAQQAILSFFEQNVLQAVFRDELMIGFGTKVADHRCYPAIQEVLQHALSDELQLHAILASTGSRMAHILPDNAAYRSQALRSTVILISKVRTVTIEHCGHAEYDPKFAHAVLELCIAAFYQGDLAAAQLHLRALKVVLQNVSHSDQLSVFVTEAAKLFDVFIALDIGSSPLIPLDWEPSDSASPLAFKTSRPVNTPVNMLDELLVKSLEPYHTTEELLSESVRQLPIWAAIRMYPDPFRSSPQPVNYTSGIPTDGLLQALELGVLSKRVSTVIAKHNLLCGQIARIILSDNSLAPNLQWINFKGMALLHLICSLGEFLASVLTPATRYLDVPALITLQVQNSMCHLPLLSRTVPKLVERLYESLRVWMTSNWLNESEDYYFGRLLASSPSEKRTSYCRTLFWVTFTGLYASLLAPKYEQWFRSRVIFLLGQLGVTSADDVARLVGRFSNQTHPALISSLVQDLSLSRRTGSWQPVLT